MKIYKFEHFINEDLTSDLVGKLSDTNKDIKEELVKMIQKSVNSDDMDLFSEKLESIVRDPKESTIEGLTQDSDVYDFYLKFRNDIDEILVKIEFFDGLQDFQMENNCIGLYDFVIKGTMEAVKDLVSMINQELSTEGPE